MPLRPALGALCGIAGPASFVAAWATAGVLADGYDPVAEAISRLAAEEAATRGLMTAGLVGFGVLMPMWARVLGRELDGRVGWATTAAGLTTLAVAALPLTAEGGTTQDTLHAVAAGSGYVAMALTPLLAAGPLRRVGHSRAAAASVAVATVSAGALAGTLLLPDLSGALQRLGLAVVDLWHVAAAGWVLRTVSARRHSAAGR